MNKVGVFLVKICTHWGDKAFVLLDLEIGSVKQGNEQRILSAAVWHRKKSTSCVAWSIESIELVHTRNVETGNRMIDQAIANGVGMEHGFESPAYRSICNVE